MKKIGILSHYCTFTTPRPSKAISSTYEESWHVVSLLKTYRPVLWHLESCFWNVFPSLTKNTLKIWTKLKDWFIEIFQPSFRYTSIRWTHAQYCHLESFLKFPTPRPATKQGDKNCSTYEESYITCGVICAHLPSSTLQSNTFNIWMELTCWVVVMNLTHLSPYRTLNMLFLPLQQNNTLNEWRACASGVIFEFLPPFDPTTQYVQHMKQIDMSSHSWNLPSPNPTKRKVQHMKKVYICFSPNRFTGLPVWGSYSFQRVAYLGRMILRLSPTCLSLVSHSAGHAGCIVLHNARLVSHLSPTSHTMVNKNNNFDFYRFFWDIFYIVF
jgi:hypothetical protein